MTRRTWTLLASLAVAVVLGIVGGVAPVPYVALGPGPTYNTLGDVDGQQVVTIEGERTFPTTGQLNMTTVSVVDQLTLYGALTMWFSGRHSLVPRHQIYPPDLSQEQIEQRNVELFHDSESAAEAAALRYLHYPTQVVVSEIVTDMPAAGVLEPGDELLVVNGREVQAPQDVVDALAATEPGQPVDVSFRRGDGPEQAVTIELGSSPDRPQGMLGIQVTERADVDFEITISLADVGGPSAGLMFALAIVDELTPGPLTGGRFVAGTGEIAPGGQVGPIGGIQFKMLRARERGATVFLVPTENCEAALQRTPDGLQLVRVATLDDAVSALESLAAGQPVQGCRG